LNATQIVKVAGVPKSKRQKTLQQYRGKDNVVQGGHVTMQGVWVSYEDAQKLCADLGVSAKFRALLTVNKGRAEFIPAVDRNV
jgi:hypothetical protein